MNKCKELFKVLIGWALLTGGGIVIGLCLPKILGEAIKIHVVHEFRLTPKSSALRGSNSIKGIQLPAFGGHTLDIENEADGASYLTWHHVNGKKLVIGWDGIETSPGMVVSEKDAR